MFYAMANLALYPDVQTRARAEVDALFNTPGATDSPTYSESYPKLQYLHGFMVSNTEKVCFLEDLGGPEVAGH